MTSGLLIALCSLILLAYFFDISASKTRIPSVILLLILGFGVKELTSILNIKIPDISSLLPLLGTVGLILIVLEGSLELELNSSKMHLIKKSALLALFPILVLSFGVAYVIYSTQGTSFKDSLINAIPFSIISSAIAIPSVSNLSSDKREFITYESSLSDIFGVLLFNFVLFNETFGWESWGQFGIELIVLLIITVLSTLILAYLLSRIKHHVKYVPIIMMVVLIYAISKLYHLPALLFILLFGLFLGNLDELKHISFIKKLKPDILNHETHKFRELTAEIAFLVRAVFFMLFGFLMELSEILNTKTILWALGICLGIFIIRFLLLKLMKISLSPLVFIAPRGLITVLLFLSILPEQQIEIVNKSLIIQVILVTALLMMFGLMSHSKTTNIEKETL